MSQRSWLIALTLSATAPVAALVACSGTDDAVVSQGDGGAITPAPTGTGGPADPDPIPGDDKDATAGGDSSTSDGGDGGDGGGGPSLSFFVTSVPAGVGGNLGGLDGADKKCQDLAAAVGAGARKWRAYLSATPNGQAAIHAKDRIGKGPWYNQKLELVAADVAALHAADLPAAKVLDEKGAAVPIANPNQHDILTGTQADGTASNGDCNNWTSNAGNQQRTVGHSDSSTSGNGADRWNFAHTSNGCSADNITATGGNGRIYCFAE